MDTRIVDDDDSGGGSNSKKFKLALTAAISFCYFSYGLGFSVMGPTLIDLSDLYSSTIHDVSFGLVGRSAVYCIGSLFCGWAFNYYNRQLGLGLSLLGCGLSIVAMPQLRSLLGFIIAQAVLGFSAAGVDTGANAWLLEIWQAESNPYMQSMHFFYALGSTVGPLLSEPFLSPDANHTIIIDNVTHIDFFNVTDTAMKTRIYIPYSICAFILFLASMLQLILFVANPYKSEHRVLGRKNDSDSTHAMTTTHRDTDEEIHLLPVTLPKSYYRIVILLGALLLCFEAGFEQNTFNYLQTFIVHVDLHLTKSKGAFMTGAMTLAYTLSRLLAIFVATRVKTLYMLYADFIIITVGNVLILRFANVSETGLWVGVVVLGFGFSSAFPAIYSFLEERINVTNSVCGFFMFASSVLTTVEPLLEGKYIESWPLVFVYINLVSVIVCLFLFMALHSTDIMKRRISQRARV